MNAFEEYKVALLSMFMFVCFVVLAAGQVISILRIRDVKSQIIDIKQEQESILSQILENIRTESLGTVTAFHYTNLPSQTDSTPNLTAWNEPVYEGMIAVSRDLLHRYLQKNDCVKLEIDGEINSYVVDDKMHPRHRRSVDIFTFSRDKKILNRKQTGRLYLMK